MKVNKIKVSAKSSKYNIYIGNNYLKNFGKILNDEKIFFKKVLIILDNKVPIKKVYQIKKSINCDEKIVIKISSSEKSKNLIKATKIIELLLRKNFTREDCVIGVGGGIVGDLSCFIASIYKRGIKFINIPTTLLAQVDASIGGKSGVNHSHFGKNLIGTFYQPKIVLSDLSFLRSLNKRELVCGYAEILKHTLIKSEKGFKFLDKFHSKIFYLQKYYLLRIISESCEIKKKVVEQDEKERNYRMILNLGHTFGHAFEAACGFKKKLNHGEGVLLGIKCAVKFSLIKNFLSYKDYIRILNHIEKININLKLNKFFNFKDIKRII